MKVNNPKPLPKCQYCSTTKQVNYIFVAMIMPIPEMEDIINKWGRDNWWKNLERNDLNDDDNQELEKLNTYDQLLNTTGRGYQCIKCIKKEDELLNKYYPQLIN